ncbi:hypothetical protein BGZ83_007504 [Gryganskiella cystojenkinii]|nr:hypothetical protein BGZ83_007504 [Gryganskiella cystojenkinii]
MMSIVDNLPTEIQILLSSYFTRHELTICIRVSRVWYELFMSRLWRTIDLTEDNDWALFNSVLYAVEPEARIKNVHRIRVLKIAQFGSHTFDMLVSGMQNTLNEVWVAANHNNLNNSNDVLVEAIEPINFDGVNDQAVACDGSSGAVVAFTSPTALTELVVGTDTEDNDRHQPHIGELYLNVLHLDLDLNNDQAQIVSRILSQSPRLHTIKISLEGSDQMQQVLGSIAWGSMRNLILQETAKMSWTTHGKNTMFSSLVEIIRENRSRIQLDFFHYSGPIPRPPEQEAQQGQELQDMQTILKALQLKRFDLVRSTSVEETLELLSEEVMDFSRLEYLFLWAPKWTPEQCQRVLDRVVERNACLRVLILYHANFSEEQEKALAEKKIQLVQIHPRAKKA